jgi:hypothetical protein
MRTIKNFFSKDSSLLVILFILGIAGLTLFHFKEQSIFPSASIDLKLSKAEIMAIAQSWADRFGYKKTGLVKSITFNDYDESKTFLEYELGNSQANTLMRDTIPIFYWYCTFRKPYDQETMDVTISPTGKLTYIEYALANDKRIPSICHSAAEEKAFAIVKEITGWGKEDCKLVDDDTTVRLNRTDHEFTWEYQKVEWHGARLRVDVDVAGNVLIGFNHYLYRPEQWDRSYSTIRTKNELLESIASVFFYLLYPVGAFIFLRGVSRGIVRWRFVIGAGGVLTLIYLFDTFNNFPELLSAYTPDSSFHAFVIKSIFYPILYAPFLFMLVGAMAGAGEIVYRNLFPDKIALEKIFTRPGLASKEVLAGLIAGAAWFGASLGYQILYYWIGHHFHFWCPLEVSNYKVLSAYFPWLSAVGLGAFAATNEEILYRILMLGLTKSVVRKFWLANLIQAAAWGFMHSTYPQQPCYARGLELTVEGVFDGWLLSRFGLLACIVSHYSFDAFDCVIPLFSAPVGLKLSSIFPFLPILICIAYSTVLNRKKRTEDVSLLNKTLTPALAAVHSKVEAIAAQAQSTYKALSSKQRKLLICFSIIGMALFVFIGSKPYSIAVNNKPLSITRDEAIRIAQKYLLDQHINSNDYKIATSVSTPLDSDSEGIQYAYEQKGLKKTKELIDEIEQSFLWSVRFVKPLTTSEYCCWITENGNIGSLEVKRGEDEPGANLNKHDAQIIAENFIKTYRQQYLPFQLKDISQTKRKHRTDYHLTFTVPRYKVGEAEFIVSIDTIGDVPANLSHGWDVPDNWKWARTKLTKRQEIGSMVRNILLTVMFLALALWIILLFRADKIRWRFAIYAAIVACVGSLVSWLNELTGFFNSYDTTTPLNTFLIMGFLGLLLSLVFLWGGTTFTIAITLAGTDHRLKQRLKEMFSTFIAVPQNKVLSQMHWDFWLDAVILACSLESVGWLVEILTGFIDRTLKHEVSIANYTQYIPGVVSAYSGPLAVGLKLAESFAFGILFIGIIIAICIQLRLTNYWRFSGLILLGYILFGLDYHYWQDFLAGGISTIVMATLCWFSVMYVVNRNILSLFVQFWVSITFEVAWEFWKLGWPTFSRELVACCVFLLYPFVYLVYLYYLSHKSGPRIQSPQSQL